MVGNATEETILRDLKHPSHRHRPVWPLAIALLAIFAGYGLFHILAASLLPVWAALAVTVVVFGALGVAAATLARRFARPDVSPRIERARDDRERREAGLARQIADARAKGDFDIWEKPAGRK